MYFVILYYSDWQQLQSLRNVIQNFIDFLMETYGHNEIDEQSYKEIMSYRDDMCSVLCKLIEK